MVARVGLTFRLVKRSAMIISARSLSLFIFHFFIRDTKKKNKGFWQHCSHAIRQRCQRRSVSLSRLNFSTAARAKSSNTHNFDLPPFVVVVVVVVGCVCLFNGHVYTSSRNDTTIHTRRNKEKETKKNWATEFACLSLSQECDTAHRAPSNPNATSPVGMPSTSCLCLPIAATLRRLSTLIIISYRASDIFQIK